MKEEKDMKNEAFVHPYIQSADQSKSKNKLYYTLAFIGICGGLGCIFTGFVFLVVHSLITGDSLFDEIGTILMFCSFPMLFGGGHFIDKTSRNVQR
jgi:hypothetical protein